MAVSSQRLELVQRLVKKTGARGLGKLLSEGTRELGLSWQHEMLGELLPQLMPLPPSMTLSIFAATAAVGNKNVQLLLDHLVERLPPSLRSDMLVRTFTSCAGGLDEAESALADILCKASTMLGEMSGLEGSRRATRLMSKIASNMAETSRGAAVRSQGSHSARTCPFALSSTLLLTACRAHRVSTCVLQVRTLLAGQTTAQKVSALGDALDSVDERDTPAVLKELVEHLTPVNRQLTLLPLLTDLVSEERTAVLSPLLADLGRDELMASLSARAQREKMLSSMPPAMLSGILSELPHTVDGARLANMLPPEALQLWGSNLLAAAPESTCKAWLTQLLVQLKAKSTYSSLSQLLVSALGPEYFAYSYANLCMDDRLHMLRCIDEIKQLTHQVEKEIGHSSVRHDSGSQRPQYALKNN